MDNKILEKIKSLGEDDSFLLTVTLLNKSKGKLDTFVITNKFPYEEFSGTKDKIADLIDRQALTLFDK